LDKHTDFDENTATFKAQEDSNRVDDDKWCPADVCITCNQKSPRINALRRHIITKYLNLIKEDLGTYCIQPACKSTAAFIAWCHF
jgi:hypothetical protein